MAEMKRNLLKEKRSSLKFRILKGIHSNFTSGNDANLGFPSNTSFKRPKWSIRPNKRLNLKCCLIFENNKVKKTNATK